MAQRVFGDVAGVPVAPGHLAKGAGFVDVQPLDFGAGQELDVGLGADALDQVVRHGRLQAGAAHKHPDLGGLARQIDRRLARGVAAADQRHLLAGAQGALDR